MMQGERDKKKSALCPRTRSLVLYSTVSGERHRNIAGLVSGLQVVDPAVSDLHAAASNGLDDFGKQLALEFKHTLL